MWADWFRELRQTSRQYSGRELRDMTVICFVLRSCRNRLEVQDSIVGSSTLEGSAKDRGDYRFSDIGIGTVDLPYLQVPPQHLTSAYTQTRALYPHTEMIRSLGEMVKTRDSMTGQAHRARPEAVEDLAAKTAQQKSDWGAWAPMDLHELR